MKRTIFVLVLLLGLILSLTSLLAMSPPTLAASFTWTNMKALASTRARHPAMLLPRRKVLAAGGRSKFTTYTVTSCDDNGAPGTLRSAIGQASAGDTIQFQISGSPCTITLTGGTLVIDKDLTLDASRSPQSVTISGGDAVQVFVVNSGISFTLNTLTIAHGKNSVNGGGGLYSNGGTVSITNSTFSYNSANNAIFGGGGLYSNGGTVSITNSTFSYNSANNSFAGGGLYSNGGMVSITNSTFSYNSANNAIDGGGGVYNDNGGTATISNSTFAFNAVSGNGTTNGTGGGFFNRGTATISNSTFSYNFADFGGGLYNDPNRTLTIAQSIVANNSAPIGSNCALNAPLTDQGYNLESGTDCNFTANTNTDLQNTDPKLASALANNRGPTQTLALRDGSPAINKIPLGPNACTITTDQRGVSRPQGPACDIGAFEFRVPILSLPSSPITVTATSPQGATVTYTVTASLPDDPSSAPIVACSLPSGSTFPIGATTVICTVSDHANPPDVTSGSFQVVVKPGTPLTLQVPGTMTVYATSPQGVVVNYTVSATSATFPSNQLTITCTPPSGSIFSVGTTTVQCKVVDPVGNVGTGSFRVVVNAGTPPTLQVPAPGTPATLQVPETIVVKATSPRGAVVHYRVSATSPTFPSTQLTIICTPPSGGLFPIGITTVQCRVVDPEGNSNTTSFRVVVKALPGHRCDGDRNDCHAHQPQGEHRRRGHTPH